MWYEQNNPMMGQKGSKVDTINPRMGQEGNEYYKTYPRMGQQCIFFQPMYN